MLVSLNIELAVKLLHLHTTSKSRFINMEILIRYLKSKDYNNSISEQDSKNIFETLIKELKIKNLCIS